MFMSGQVIEVGDANFESEVLQSERPVLVDFWAEWCAPCRMIAPTIERLAGQYAGRARMVKVNVDESPATAQRYGIRGMPTLILFSGGKEAERVVGAVGADALGRVIEKHVGAAV
jgi:thioredoxin 1